jgi:hypothetical protein
VIPLHPAVTVRSVVWNSNLLHSLSEIPPSVALLKVLVMLGSLCETGKRWRYPVAAMMCSLFETRRFVVDWEVGAELFLDSVVC